MEPSAAVAAAERHAMDYPASRTFSAFLLPATVLAASLSAQVPAADPSEGADSGPVQGMESFHVKVSRLTATDAAGPDRIRRYDTQRIIDTGAFSVEEFLQTLPRPRSGAEQLILVDGRPTYLDPTALPPSMIAAIEYTDDGAMPAYGAYSSGRIINIRLKKDSPGQEFAGQTRLPFAGGGEQHSLRLAGGVVRDALRVIYSVDFRREEALSALQRAYSREQDHRARGGRDLRIPWGYPATIRAVSGDLSGVFDAEGNATPVALVPAGQDGTGLVPADFIPGDARAADGAGLRRFNTAPYRFLVPPAERTRANLGFDYTFSDRLQLSLNGSVIATRGRRRDAPPVTPASAANVVPAALNPFGQDVSVGLVHVGFGPTEETTRATRSQIGLQLSGQLGESWKWNGGLGYRHDDNRQRARALDEELFALALAEPDPARRFHPFGDAALTPLNASLYPGLEVERTREIERARTELELSASGPIGEIPGGPVVVSLNGEAQQESRRQRTQPRPEASESSRRQTRAAEVSATATLPLFDEPNARPALQRLETRLSGEYEGDDDGGSEVDLRVDTVWQPADYLVVRARLSLQEEQPARGVLPDTGRLVGETVIDPRRGSIATSDVQMRIGDLVDGATEETTRGSIGLTLEPPFIQGLEFSVTYQERLRRNVYEDEFETQDLVNNESALPGRVIRREPTSEDLARGWPGELIAVDATPGSIGRRDDRELEFELEYSLPGETFGRFRVSASAEWILEQRREILPGVAFVEEGGLRRGDPDWEFQAMVAWSGGGWNASVRAEYLGAIPGRDGSPGLSSFTTVALNLEYTLARGLYGRIGEGARLGLRLDNVFDEPPPWADTLSGYRSGSPLGRALLASVTLPF